MKWLLIFDHLFLRLLLKIVVVKNGRLKPIPNTQNKIFLSAFESNFKKYLHWNLKQFWWITPFQAARIMEEQQKKKKGKRKGLGGLSPEKKKMLKVGVPSGTWCAPRCEQDNLNISLLFQIWRACISHFKIIKKLGICVF